MSFRLTEYGRREWWAATVVAAAGCAALAVMAWLMSWMCLLPVGPIVLVWLWTTWFFRDPDRQVPSGEGLFVSPADGRVTDITPLGADGPLGTEGLQVGVFMSLFNVHVNRAPCDGRVESVEHRPGLFLDARKPEASSRNESATIRLTHKWNGCDWPVIVRQVAGLIARRIITAPADGQDLRRGERLGMIKFGSRLELIVPRELIGEVRVAVGDRVLAGRTVLIAAAPNPDKKPNAQQAAV